MGQTSWTESDQEKVISGKLGLQVLLADRNKTPVKMKNLEEFRPTGPLILVCKLVYRRMIDVFCKLVINNRFFKMKFKTFLNEV